MLQVCLNGSRNRAHCPVLPVTAAELAEAARAAVAAGADDIHLHPKSSDGADTLDPAVVAEVLTAVRAAVPGVPVGVTTGAWTIPDARRRAELVRAWTVLPDHASVDWHGNGADLVARALWEKGVGIEAGLRSGTDAAERFRTSPFAGRVLRVLAVVTDTEPLTALGTATALLRSLGPGLRAPVLLHGEEGGAWPVLRRAAALGLARRVGLEDVTHTPDGRPAADNAALVRAARAVPGLSGRHLGPQRPTAWNRPPSSRVVCHA
ncbi:3-keto-5-aminohexanoate cleavage protein [Streptomyces sp. ISL-11]|uniref:3-keto-5-aminohexanoate cleavage protein n=1 Tax=Streptomyces sp. ISL-11 TaxID=2819174 RepID=UPI001BE5D6DC|nr:3-keto-5-aminohexanoate cleavage protein [Streptomyces sp. ISL-11]MBT2387566.1 3-keto-5-aminohexanoate cleavage protein [Streptomyces sp. ISL-11]